MKKRLSLPSRMTMIIVIALTTVWLGAVGIYFLSMDNPAKQNWPSAERVEAIVALMERTPISRLSEVSEALQSDILDVSIESGPLASAYADEAEPLTMAAVEKYGAALAGREFIATTAQPHNLVWRLLHVERSGRKILGLRIQLATGGILAIEVGNAVGVSPLGLPVGLLAGLFGTLVALAALVGMHRETRPLSRLAWAVDRIDISGTPVILPRPNRGAPEIGALVDAFDRLQIRLSQLLRARMAMLGGISHDVRTFATRLRLRVELIPEGRERDRAISDISDIIRLLDDGLLASRAGVGELSEELLEFAGLVRAEVEDRQAEGAAVDLGVEPEAEAATVLGDPLALKRVVFNLVDNALKYGKVAHVSVHMDTLRLILTVDDEGSGIPLDKRDILLEPFVRLEASRSRDTGGSGLGLAIVRNLVEAHNGTVAIADKPGGGGRIVITLPVFIP